MKKTLLSVLAGLTVMGSAFADGPSVEDRKKLCQLLIDKGTHVWVEKTKACIPVHPCSSEDESIRKAYCDMAFLETGRSTIESRAGAKLLREHLYTKANIETSISSNDNAILQSWQIDDDVLGGGTQPVLLVQYDGMYLEMPFTEDKAAKYTADGTACWIFAGELHSKDETLNTEDMHCYFTNRQSCERLANFLSDLHGEKMDFTWSDNVDCRIKGTRGMIANDLR